MKITEFSEHDESCPKKPHVHWFETEGKWRVEIYNIKAPFIGKDEQRNLGATFIDYESALKCHDILQVAVNLRGIKGT